MQILKVVAIWFIAEVIVNVGIRIVSASMPGKRAFAQPITEAFKGAIERLVLFVGLTSGFGQVLIFFGAVKIANRLTEEDKSDESRSYFIVGNMLSVLAVFGYYWAYKNELWAGFWLF